MQSLPIMMLLLSNDLPSSENLFISYATSELQVYLERVTTEEATHRTNQIDDISVAH